MKAKYFFIFLILSCLLIAPSFAEIQQILPNMDMLETRDYGEISPGSFSISEASAGLAVVDSLMILRPGQTVDMVLHFNSGLSVPAHVYYTTGLIDETFDIGIGSSQHVFNNLGILRLDKAAVIGYAIDNTTSSYYISLYQADPFALPFSAFNTGTGVMDPVLYYPLSGTPSSDPIIQVDFNTNTGIHNLYSDLATVDQIAENEGYYETGPIDYIGWLTSIITSIWSALMFAWSIFYFIFIEHLMMVIILTEGAIFAYELNTKPNVFRAFSAVAQDNIKLFEFAVGAVQKIISLVWDLLNMFNPMRWIFGK